MKEFLSKKDVSYEDRDVSRDETALNDLQKLGFMTTPVTVIDGEVVVGFDQEKLGKLLGPA